MDILNKNLIRLSSIFYKVIYNRCYVNEVMCINELDNNVSIKYKESISFILT